MPDSSGKETIIYELRIDTTQSQKALDDSTKSVDKNTDAIKKSKTALEAEEDSITKVREENKKLTAERNAASTKTEEGRKKIIELNEQLNKNNEIIKQNVDLYTKQKINVGNYTQGILEAIPGVGNFSKGVSGLNATFKANPIGAVIGILLTLKEILGANAVVADQLSFIFAGFSKGLGAIIDKIVDTVTSLDKLTEALTSPIKFFTDLASGVSDAAKSGYDAAKAIDEFTVVQAKANQEIRLGQIAIDALTKSLKDRTKTEKERIAIANEIADKEIEQTKRVEDLAQKELENEKLKLKGKTLSGEEEAKLIDLETQVKLAAAETQIIASQRQTRINILLAKEETQALKEQQKEQIFNLEAAKDIEIAMLTDKEAQKILLMKQSNSDQQSIHLEAIDQWLRDEDAKTNEEYKAAVKAADDKAKLDADLATKKLSTTSKLSGQLSNILGKQTTEGKVAAASQAGVNTYEGATAQLKLPFPFNIIASGLTIAEGLLSVSKILGFADSGITGTLITSGMGTPVNRSNGDNMLATVKTGEVILNERHQRALGGSATFAAIGVPGFANSGLVGYNPSNLASNNYNEMLNNVVDAVNKIQPILVLEDFEAAYRTKTEAYNKSKVL